MEVNGNELAILKTVEAVGCLPVARFVATKSDEEEVVIDCLSPVYLYDEHDTMEDVKSIGAVLKGLEEKNLLSLDVQTIVSVMVHERFHRRIDIYDGIEVPWGDAFVRPPHCPGVLASFA